MDTHTAPPTREDVRVRAASDRAEAWRRAARASGVSLSAWLGMAGDHYARQIFNAPVSPTSGPITRPDEAA